MKDPDDADPHKANVCARSRSYRSHSGKRLRSTAIDHIGPIQQKNLDPADHTDPTLARINVCERARSCRSHLGKRMIRAKARKSCRFHLGKRVYSYRASIT